MYLNVTQTHTHCFFPWCEHVDLNRLGFVAVRLLGWTASNFHLRAKQKGALACRRLYLLNCAADSRNNQLLEPISLSATGVIQFFELWLPRERSESSSIPLVWFCGGGFTKCLSTPHSTARSFTCSRTQLLAFKPATKIQYRGLRYLTLNLCCLDRSQCARLHS